MLDTNARKVVQPMIRKTANAFIKRNVTADQVTILALIIGVIPSILLALHVPAYIAVIILWTSGYLDAVDGTIARITKSSSPFGTIMDIVFDRIVEISLIIVLAYLYPESTYSFVLLGGAIILSMTIFLTVGAASEKASEKSFYYQPGLGERTEGFIMFTLMMLLPQHINELCLIFAGIVLFTAVQRFVEAYKHFKE